MALNTRRSAVLRNAMVDAGLALLNGGFIDVYDGTQPATPETAAAGTKLARFAFANPAFAASSAGVATANPIAATTGLAASTATWFRCLKTDGTTAVMDGSVGATGCNMNLSTTAISVGGAVSLTSFTHTEPMQGS